MYKIWPPHKNSKFRIMLVCFLVIRLQTRSHGPSGRREKKLCACSLPNPSLPNSMTADDTSVAPACRMLSTFLLVVTCALLKEAIAKITGHSGGQVSRELDGSTVGGVAVSVVRSASRHAIVNRIDGDSNEVDHPAPL